MSGLNNDKKRLMEKINTIETMLLKEKSQDEEDNKKKIIEEFLKIKNPDKIMMSNLIKRIEIDKNKNVKIYFNFNIKGEN